MDRLSGISRHEGCRGQVKRSTIKFLASFGDDHYTSTSRMYDNHFGTEEVIPGSGENEGPTEDTSTMPGTNAGRRSEGYQ